MSTKLTYTGAEVQELLGKIEKGDFDNAKTLEGHPASYFAIASEFTSLAGSFAAEQGRVNTLHSYFNNGSANDALRLGGQLPSYYATATQYEILQRTLSDFKSLFDSMFEKDSDGNIHAKLSLWSSGGITAGDVGNGGSGGGGGVSYSRLDAWADYSADKSGWVLSALLGNDLNTRLTSVENAGYVTASALAPYALRSEIPSLVGYATESFVTSQGYITASALGGYATHSWVSDNYLSKAGGTMTGSLCVSMYGWSNQLVLNGVDSNAGIEFRYSNTYVAALYCVQSNPYWHMGENAYPILHSGNYSDYALPITGGTVNGEIELRPSGDKSIIFPKGEYLDQWGNIRLLSTSGSWNVLKNNQTLFMVQANGNVAIGGTTADAKLHVHGDANITSDITLGGRIYASGDFFISHSETGRQLSFDPSFTILGTDNLYNGIPTYIDGHNVYIRYANDTAISSFLSNGNVAIGGTTADEKLHVHGNGKFTGVLLSQALRSAGISIGCDASGVASDNYTREINTFANKLYLQYRGGDLDLCGGGGTTYLGGALEGKTANFTSLTAPAVTTNTLKVGNVTLVEENGVLKVIGGFIATGGVTSGEKAS